MERFEYPRLGSESKKQATFLEKQYHGLSKLSRSDEEEESVTVKKEKSDIIGKSKLMYDSNYRKYYPSFTTKYDKLNSFYH